MPTFKKEHWARDIAAAIRNSDPSHERDHILWADKKSEALEALRSLAAELEAKVVSSRRVIELDGGGRVEGHDTKSFSGSNYCVGVWLASAEVPGELTFRADAEQFAELWIPE